MAGEHEWEEWSGTSLITNMSSLAATTNYNLRINGEFVGQVTVTPQPEGMRAWAVLFSRTFPRISDVCEPEAVPQLKELLLREAMKDYGG